MRAERSLEALEITAVQALAVDADEARTRATGAAPPEHPPRFPDVSSVGERANATREVDPWRAALLAETHLTASRRRAWRALLAEVDRCPVVLRTDDTSLALDAVEAATLVEPNPARREAVQLASTAEAAALRDEARAVIDAVRTSLGALDPSLVTALGLADGGHGDIVDATEDLYRELDAWVCRGLLIDRARLTWADRLRTLQGPATLAAIPSATWASLGARAFERVGLDAALRGVVDDLRPAAPGARGVFARVTAPGERALVAGRASLSAWGAADVMGALSVATLSVTARGPFAGVRRGCDRAVDGVAHALGRRLLGERRFLQREAGVDAAPRERVMLEAAHGEILRVRFDAARSRFAAHVLAKGPEAAARFHDELMRAWGAAPPPAWAPWTAAWMCEAGGFWGAPAAARTLGARVEPLVVDAMRARYDEDWFRNPKASQGLAEVFEAMRAVGVRAWCDARGGAVDAARTAARLAEVARDARRGA
jgi:hypothetical protein